MPFTRQAALVVALTSLSCLLASRAQAQEVVDAELRAVAAAEAHADSAEAETATRLHEVTQVLERDARQTRLWRGSWMAFQATLIAGSLGWLSIDHDTAGARAEHLINAGSSTIGLLALIFNKTPVLHADDELAKLPERTPEERKAKLARAEQLLDESAKVQAFNMGFAPFIGGTVVGLASGLPLWLKYDRKLAAAGSFFGSLTVTALQVLTLPVGALRSKQRSQAAAVSVSLAPGFRGLSMTGRW